MFHDKKMQKMRKKIAEQTEEWAMEKVMLEHEYKLDQERSKLKKKKMSWSKLLLIFLFFNFTILELFVGWVTIESFALAFSLGVSPDFTPLITLMGSVIGETLSYWIYTAKAKAENTQGGIVYDTAMRDQVSDETQN